MISSSACEHVDCRCGNPSAVRAPRGGVLRDLRSAGGLSAARGMLTGVRPSPASLCQKEYRRFSSLAAEFQSEAHQLRARKAHVLVEEYLVRGAVAEDLARSVIECLGERGRDDARQVVELGSLRDVLPNEPVGVLDRAALPRRARVGEEDREAASARNA